MPNTMPPTLTYFLTERIQLLLRHITLVLLYNTMFSIFGGNADPQS